MSNSVPYWRCDDPWRPVCDALCGVCGASRSCCFTPRSSPSPMNGTPGVVGIWLSTFLTSAHRDRG
jgi:hypothetical protein